MPTITSTYGVMENISKEMIIQARYTEEHNAPSKELTEKFRLGEGEDTLVVPKVGQMTLKTVTEGQTITNEMDIGLSTNSFSTSLVGGKVVITERQMRRTTMDTWKVVGRQIGDAWARKHDQDVQALYTALNGGTTLGAAGAPFSAANVIGCLGVARTNKYGSDLYCVHHPNSILRLNRDLAVIGSGTVTAIPEGFSASRLRKYWDGINISGVPFFHSGNITRDASDDAIGVLADRSALGFLSGMTRRERKKDPEIAGGGWIMIVEEEYTAFEIDDTRGAPLTYDAANPATS